MKRSVYIILAVGLLVPVLLTSCAKIAPDVPALLEPAVVDIDTAVATVSELYDLTCYEGLVEPKIDQLSFSAGGVIFDVYVSLGSSVKKGDVLAQLDTGMAQIMADSLTSSIDYSIKSNKLLNKQSECDISIAEIELEQLIAESADSAAIELKEIQIENLKNTYNTAVKLQDISLEKNRNELAEYLDKIKNSKITATCDGTVLYCTAKAGGWAMAYSTVIWVADDSSSYISCQYIKADELDSAYEIYATIAGERAEITNVPYDRVTYMSLLASNSTLRSNFSIDSTGSEVENGMYAYVMLLKDYVAEALVVPANALVQDGVEYYVYLISSSGAQIRQTVKTGVKTQALVQITEGLKEGDVVYVGN